MINIIVFVLLWLVCSMPFVMMGVPSEAAGVLGLIAGIVVIVWMACNSDDTSTQQPTRSSSSSRSVTDEDIEDMIMLDVMSDGKPDGKFDF